MQFFALARSACAKALVDTRAETAINIIRDRFIPSSPK
jgi:hypothetical protein